MSASSAVVRVVAVEERVELGVVVVAAAAGDRRRQGEAGRVVVGRPVSPSSRNGLYSVAEVVERLAGEGLEGRPALALLAGRDVGRRARSRPG